MKCVEITKEKILTVSEIEKPTSKDGSVIIKVESFCRLHTFHKEKWEVL